MFLNFIGSNKKKIKLKLFDNESLKQAHKRIFFTISFFILIYLSIFFKLTDVMIVSNLFDKNQEIAKIDDKIKILNRGNIYDRNGEVLARTVVIPKLYLDTNLIDNDIEEYLLFLNHYLPEEDFSYLEEDAVLKNKVIDIGLISNELYNVINLSSSTLSFFL